MIRNKYKGKNLAEAPDLIQCLKFGRLMLHSFGSPSAIISPYRWNRLKPPSFVIPSFALQMFNTLLNFPPSRKYICSFKISKITLVLFHVRRAEIFRCPLFQWCSLVLPVMYRRSFCWQILQFTRTVDNVDVSEHNYHGYNTQTNHIKMRNIFTAIVIKCWRPTNEDTMWR